ncbi:MAG: helix-turn-helix domain-containing protein [Bacteroidales bacterium]
MNNHISDNILSLISKTPDSIMLSIADKIRQRRLERDWTQQLLASKADMPISTYRRFEKTGEISIRSLVMISFALGLENDLLELFSTQTYQSVEELLNISYNKGRKRGGKK